MICFSVPTTALRMPISAGIHTDRSLFQGNASLPGPRLVDRLTSQFGHRLPPTLRLARFYRLPALDDPTSGRSTRARHRPDPPAPADRDRRDDTDPSGPLVEPNKFLTGIEGFTDMGTDKLAGACARCNPEIRRSEPPASVQHDAVGRIFVENRANALAIKLKVELGAVRPEPGELCAEAHVRRAAMAPFSYCLSFTSAAENSLSATKARSLSPDRSRQKLHVS